jgi:hypothetical protein
MDRKAQKNAAFLLELPLSSTTIEFYLKFLPFPKTKSGFLFFLDEDILA